MIAADAERHALGRAAGEVRMQQRVKLFAVAGGKRSIQRASEIGWGAALHPKTPVKRIVISGVSAGVWG